MNELAVRDFGEIVEHPSHQALVDMKHQLRELCVADALERVRIDEAPEEAQTGEIHRKRVTVDVNEAGLWKLLQQQRDATGVCGVLDEQRTPVTLEADLGEKATVMSLPQRAVRLVVEENAAGEKLAGALGEVEGVIEAQRRQLSERKLVFVWAIDG